MKIVANDDCIFFYTLHINFIVYVSFLMLIIVPCILYILNLSLLDHIHAGCEIYDHT